MPILPYQKRWQKVAVMWHFVGCQ